MLCCFRCAVERKLLGAVLYGDNQLAACGHAIAQVVIELSLTFEQEGVVTLKASSSCLNSNLDATGRQENLDLHAFLRRYWLVLVDKMHVVFSGLTTERDFSV